MFLKNVQVKSKQKKSYFIEKFGFQKMDHLGDLEKKPDIFLPQ